MSLQQHLPREERYLLERAYHHGRLLPTQQRPMHRVETLRQQGYLRTGSMGSLVLTEKGLEAITTRRCIECQRAPATTSAAELLCFMPPLCDRCAAEGFDLPYEHAPETYRPEEVDR